MLIRKAIVMTVTNTACVGENEGGCACSFGISVRPKCTREARMVRIEGGSLFYFLCSSRKAIQISIPVWLKTLMSAKPYVCQNTDMDRDRLHCHGYHGNGQCQHGLGEDASSELQS